MLTECLVDPASLFTVSSRHEGKDVISCEHVAHVSTKTSSLDCDIQQQINVVSTVQPSSMPGRSDLSLFQSKSNDELSQAQRQDPVLKHVFSLKEKYKNEPPKWQEISHLSPSLKSYWSQWKRIEIVNKVLYREGGCTHKILTSFNY